MSIILNPDGRVVKATVLRAASVRSRGFEPHSGYWIYDPIINLSSKLANTSLVI